MARKSKLNLADYLELKYPYSVTEDEGEFVVTYPDLPGCVTQVERSEDIHAMANEARELWLETMWEIGGKIPEAPARDFSGKLVIRIPKSLHRDLSYMARDEGMSLNSFILHLLSAHSAASAIARQATEQVTESLRSKRKTRYSVELPTPHVWSNDPERTVRPKLGVVNTNYLISRLPTLDDPEWFGA